MDSHRKCFQIFIIIYLINHLLANTKKSSENQSLDSHNLENTQSFHSQDTLKENSTIKELPFQASLDANILKKNIHYFGTNEANIIKVLTRRTTSQRLKILQAYNSDYNKNLVEKLKQITTGRFKDVLVALLTPKYEFLAKTLNQALRNVDSRKTLLIDILCTLRTNSEIDEINLTYQTLFKKRLESHIVKVTNSRLTKLLVLLSKAERNEHENATIEVANRDAQTLYQSANSSIYIKLLTRRSFPQINLLLEEYERQYSHSLVQAVEDQFNGYFKRGLLAIMKSARSPAKYWAERLHESLINVLGPIDEDLIFILITRAEIDLESIKQEYRIMYRRSLAQHISENTHGDYKNTLLAMLGTNEISMTL